MKFRNFILRNSLIFSDSLLLLNEIKLLDLKKAFDVIQFYSRNMRRHFFEKLTFL